MRALYGILLTSANLKSRHSNENSNKEIAENILQKYTESMPQLLPFVKQALKDFMSA